ncbi:F-box domain [Macleaya cordata]|uniref:F-box domain n=1 Tax=Macleaya cordata TaxID=56857 RepID=A0A200PM08_MACCD|nr:F-box domain [Macleaya cordata]
MLSLTSCKNRRTTTGGRNSDDNLLPENTSSSSSSSVIASNIDLLIQILLCLPVKSLLVFKSVSKEWLSLISDPSFITKHCLQNRNSNPRLFLHNSWLGINPPEFEFIFLDGRKVTESSLPFKTLNFSNDSICIKIEQSCNGLLCCSSCANMERTYYIYNPSTKQYREIIRESLAMVRRSLSICSVSLAFDPYKSPHYKAVCIWMKLLSTNPIEGPIYQIEIYSSKTASWRVSGNAFIAPPDIFSTPGVFWNGSLHWINRLEEGSSLYFDVDRELVKTMPMPPIPDEWDERMTEYFGECRGHMHLIEIYGPCTSFDILEMETDYSGWNVKYRVNLDSLKIAYPEMVRDVSDEFVDRLEFFVLLVEEEEEESSSSKLVLQIPDKVISYDLKEMSFMKIHDLAPSLHGEGSAWYQWLNAYQYVEILSCV